MSITARDVCFFVGGAVVAFLLSTASDIFHHTNKVPAPTVANPRNTKNEPYASPRKLQTRVQTHVAAKAIAQPKEDVCSGIPSLTPRELIFGFLKRGDLEKGEFETSSEFAKRMRTAVGTLQTVTVAVPIPDGFISYDADKETFKVDTLMLELLPSNTSSNGYHGIVLKQTETDGASYIGQNAFGVSREIHVENDENIDIAIESKNLYSSSKTIRFRTDALTAKSLKSNVCLLVGGKPIAPLKYEYTDHPTPTIDRTYVTNTHTVALVLRPFLTKLIDARSNKVLAVFEPSLLQ